MKIYKENSTHKAVENKEKNRIDIILKGIKIPELEIKEEYLYSIPIENKDDLFHIFENIEEENRILKNEFIKSITTNI